MVNRNARALFFVLCVLPISVLPSRALDSSGVLLRNTRSSLDSGGVRKFSAGYRSDASAGLVSVPSAASPSYRNRDGFRGMAYQPGRITDLFASSTAFTSALALQWTAPGNDGDEGTTAASYTLKYSSVAADAPGLSRAKFDAADAVTVPPPPAAVRGTVHTLTITGLAPGVTYYFAIETSERDGVRSVFSATAVARTSTGAGALANTLPQEPYGVALTSAAASVTLRWMPVARYSDMTPFVNASAAQNTELTGYRVYRATVPIQAAWTDASLALSSATLTWTDTSGGPQYFYHVKAENAFGQSAASVIRTGATRSAYVVAPDDMSYFEVLSNELQPIEGVANDPDSAFLIRVSSHPEELGSLNGRVMKSLQFDAYRGGRLLAPDFNIASKGLLHLHYDLGAGSAVVPSAVAARPGSMSVYWDNGKRWVQLYGKTDPVTQSMSVETRYFGRYQLRLVERAQNFAFNQAGLSNRFVTPNGDGKNDNVVFVYDNPRDAEINGRILDRQGRVIVGSLPAGPTGNSFLWDGTAGGRPVPGGVYIYQLQGEGLTYSGTVVVVK